MEDVVSITSIAACSHSGALGAWEVTRKAIGPYFKESIYGALACSCYGIKDIVWVASITASSRPGALGAREVARQTIGP